MRISTAQVLQGAKKTECLGLSRGGISTKIHATCDALGNPISFKLTPGQASDLEGADALLPGLSLGALLADRAYDAEERVRKLLRETNTEAVIPIKKSRLVAGHRRSAATVFRIDSWSISAPCEAWTPGTQNETFNTLKNLGYNYEHNYGHGKQHLSSTLAGLTLLTFLTDQIQQHACQLYKTVHKTQRVQNKE